MRSEEAHWTLGEAPWFSCMIMQFSCWRFGGPLRALSSAGIARLSSGGQLSLHLALWTTSSYMEFKESHPFTSGQRPRSACSDSRVTQVCSGSASACSALAVDPNANEPGVAAPSLSSSQCFTSVCLKRPQLLGLDSIWMRLNVLDQVGSR